MPADMLQVDMLQAAGPKPRRYDVINLRVMRNVGQQSLRGVVLDSTSQREAKRRQFIRNPKGLPWCSRAVLILVALSISPPWMSIY